MTRPWHLPIISIVAVIWTAMLVADHMFTMLGMPVYRNNLTPDQSGFLMALPIWLKALWAFGAWSGLLGAILMWIRQPVAPGWLGISFLCLLFTVVWLIFMGGALAVTGPAGVGMMLGAIGLSCLIYLYARQMHAAGHL
ncbi:MAG: hypothetical protein AAF982_12670 [Pseudomonadota bacterium]